MRVRKTWFGYLEWFLFSCSLLFVFYLVWNSFFKTCGLTGVLYPSLCTASVLATLFIVFLLLYRRIGTLFRDYEVHSYRNMTLSVLCLLILAALLIGIRMDATQGYNELVQASSYYNTAMIRPDVNGTINGFVSIEDSYTALLSLCLRLFGNKTAVPVILQIVLQLGTFFLTFFAVERMAGKTAGLITCGFLVFMTTQITNISKADPAALQLFLYAFVLFTFTFYRNHIETDRLSWLRTLLWGLLAGLLYAYQGEFLAFILLTVTVLFEKKWENVTMKWCNITLSVLMSALGLLILLLVHAYSQNLSVAGYLVSFFQNRYSTVWNAGVLQNVGNSPFLLVLVSAASFFVFTFCMEQDEKGHRFILPFFVMALSWFFLSEKQFSDRESLSFFFLAMITAAGISNFIFAVKAEKKGVNMEDETPKNPSEPETVKEDTARYQAMDDTVEFIENPLPLPKRHERKEMTYAFEPEEEMMHYDIEPEEENQKYDIE